MYATVRRNEIKGQVVGRLRPVLGEGEASDSQAAARRIQDLPVWYVRDIYYLIILSPIIVFMVKRGIYSILVMIITCLVLPFIQPHIPIILPAPYEILAFSFGVYMQINSKSFHFFEGWPWL